MTRAWIALAALVVGVGCIAPDERRPGLWLSGSVVETPAEWSFTKAHREIAVEVKAPYGLRHSVTVWCAELDGTLYLGARDPDEKRWPAWADRRPDVRLGIDDAVYRVRLAPVDDPALVARIRAAYAAKYELPPAAAGAGPPIRYWRVDSRS